MTERILVVDDDPDALALIQLMLRRRGFEVETAPGGAEALEFLANDLPDLVLLDLMMPFMDGHEVCTRLRADPRTASLPIVMLTAKSQVASRVEAFRLGADDYVVKPVHPDELMNCIRAVLGRAAEARIRPSPKGIVIGCMGCKGGVGTTTVAVNLAMVLATRGQVALADMAGDAMIYLGQSPFDWPVVLSKIDAEQIDRRAIERAWVTHSNTLRLLYDTELLSNHAHLEAVLSRLTDMVDFSVVDLGAWTFANTSNKQRIITDCKSLALVVAPGRVEVERAHRILRQLNDWHITTPVYPVLVIRAQNSSAEVVALKAGLDREIEHVISYMTEALVVSQPNAPTADALRKLADALTK